MPMKINAGVTIVAAMATNPEFQRAVMANRARAAKEFDANESHSGCPNVDRSGT